MANLILNGTLSKYALKLEALLPLMEQTLQGNCCQKARMKSLSYMLSDMFKQINISASRSYIYKEPKKCYQEFKKIILNDNTLTSEQKIKILKSI